MKTLSTFAAVALTSLALLQVIPVDWTTGEVLAVSIGCSALTVALVEVGWWLFRR